MAVKNYKFIISYDGSRYYGWEHQPDRETIQGKLETVLSRMCNVEMVDVIGAGRTDAGVHAKAMVANAFLDVEMDTEEILAYMNRYLPDDIVVQDVRVASERFHSRYNAVGKTYRYTCYVGKTKPVFDRKYVTRLEYHPDVEKMRQATEYIIGKRDFKSFCGNNRFKKSTIRIVDRIDIKERNGYLTIEVHGTGFLQNMVRIMVGTLLEVGQGSYPPEHVEEILESRERKNAGPTAPAAGLCLMKVDYM